MTAPTDDQLACPLSFDTHREADRQREAIEEEHAFGGLLVIEHRGRCYVVYGPDYVGGWREQA